MSLRHAEPEMLSDLETTVDQILTTIEGDLVLALPLGIGKPNPLVNALYRRIRRTPERRLKIFTALSLERPQGHSELEQHFLAPLVERVFGDYPDLDYVKDLRGAGLPPNVEVHEFFLKTGDYLGNEAAQQNFICTNYSFVARDMVLQGVNLLMQAVAAREVGGELQLSLSCNPDVTLDLMERLRELGHPVLAVAMVNEELPFMHGQALVAPGLFDLVLRAPSCNHRLFAPPNASISWADYAIGLHASTLVRDGGTLQIGIGSLGDAIAQALIVRDQRNADYRRIVAALGTADVTGQDLAPFKQGLYGCSEMFVNGFMQLIDAGIVRREVFDDLVLQTLANEGLLPTQPDADVLQRLVTRGRIAAQLRERDVQWLRDQGLLQAGVALVDGHLVLGQARVRADLEDEDCLTALRQGFIGDAWRRSAFMHGGFFLGPTSFYQRLRALPNDVRQRIHMNRILNINELYDDALASEALKRAQRRKATFINTTMKLTLLGAAASDALASGQVVAGVGGQYNFVSMAHALSDARSVLVLRATHDNKDGLQSSIHWSYANCTIPRHLRDVVVTEYGVADLRGQPDNECIKRLLAIADSRFQQELMAEAKAHGKLEAAYQLPSDCQNNRPERLREVLRPWRNSGVLPDFPFGTDLLDDELVIVRALKKLKHASTHPAELVPMIIRSLRGAPEVPPAYLERLGLDDAHSFKHLFLRRLFAANL